MTTRRTRSRSELGEDISVHHQPVGPAFDIVLIVHVGCVVVSLVTLVASVTTASRLRTGLRGGTAQPRTQS